MSLSARKKLILLKLESTTGEDATPIGANAMLASNASISVLEAETVDRGLLKPYMGADSVMHVGEHIKLSFSIENQSFGTSASVPAFGEALRACGMLETIDTTVGSESATYTPRSEDFESVTIYYYEDKVLHKVIGCKGTFGFGFEPSSLTHLAFSFTGFYAGPIADTLPVADWSAFMNPLPVGPKNSSNFKLHGYAGNAHKLNIEAGVEVSYSPTITTEEIRLSDRKATGSITIDAPELDEINFIERARLSEAGALTLQHGKEKGFIVEIAMPNIQLMSPKYGDVDGTTTLEMSFNALPSKGNDDFSLTYR